jgi:O-6-methylguanine DNA methyltransferase
METIYHTSFQSAIGSVYVASTERGVCKVSIPESTRQRFFQDLEERYGDASFVESQRRHADVIDELNRYLDRRLTRFRVRLDPRGTLFQQQVWSELLKIPYGTTVSYKELAKRAGTPGGYQAVGRANASNPIAIIIPCHRVLGARSELTGYAGGVKTKEFLLRLEGALMM